MSYDMSWKSAKDRMQIKILHKHKIFISLSVSTIDDQQTT